MELYTVRLDDNESEKMKRLDAFAAAAVTGLLASNNYYIMSEIPKGAFLIAEEVE